MNKIFLYLFLITLSFSFNINNASDTDWNKLLNIISEEKINSIKIHMLLNGNIENIYELIEIDGISSADVDNLKSFIFIKGNKNNSLLKRTSYKLENWLSSSENQEGLSGNWLDQYFDPMNVNEMNYDDLNSLPNLTPIDVRAVLLQKQRGYINGTFELKNSPGISYYGYKNLLDFVNFDSSNNSLTKANFRFKTLVRNTPLTSTPDDDASLVEFYI